MAQRPSVNEQAYIDAAKELGIYLETKTPVDTRSKLLKIANKLSRGSAVVIREVPSHVLMPDKEFATRWNSISRMDAIDLSRKRAQETGCYSQYIAPAALTLPAALGLRCDFVIIIKSMDGRIKYQVIELNGFFHENNIKDIAFAKQLLEDACKNLIFKDSKIPILWIRCTEQSGDKDSFKFDLSTILMKERILA